MFIFLEKDNFEANSRSSGAAVRGQQSDREGKESAPIRRPYRGIQIKNDTYAVLSVRRPDGSPVPLASSSAVVRNNGYAGGMGAVDEYSDFILQQVNDQRMEKQQIIETFGDTFVYFFGERPRMVTFTGQLMNTEDFNWRAQFWYNYENYLRGSRLVQLNARCYLAYDTIVIEGYPISAVASDDADNPYQVAFSMTMLMTDYHEYSTIGEMRFPGVKANDLKTLNQELEETRKSFVSTTLEVRKHNMNAKMSRQIPQTNSALALLRDGIDAWNSANTWLGDKLATANRLLGGRALRMPVGAASYLTMMNEAEIGAATASIVTTGTSAFDAKYGKYFGDVVINGVVIPGNKLMIMGPSKFAPSWVSKVTGTSRGLIYENYDEYPTRTQPSSLASMMSKSQYIAWKKKVVERQFAMKAFNQQLALFNEVAASGDLLSTIANVVSAVRQGFGLVMTAANVIRDPLGAVTSAIGVTPQDVKRIGEGLAEGSFIPGVSWFIGGAAKKTWANWLDTVGSAKIGDVFNGFEYQANGTKKPGAAEEGEAYKSLVDRAPEDVNYEMVYGDSDYTPLIGQQATADAYTATSEGDLPEGVDRTEPNAGKTAQALDEVYGNTDSASYGEDRDSPSSIEEVYGQSGTIQRTVPSGEERAKMIQEAYNGDAPPNDTDTSGITTADADSAPIDPVI